MTYRVIQWATGLVGQEAIKGIVAHPELELVGCWVHSDNKVGRDAGEIAGIGPLGVIATHSLDEICAIDADAVVYSPMMADEGEILALLRSGKNVVTPIGYIFPRRNERTAEVEAACIAGGVTLHGTGEHPGGITERFPLMVSALVPQHPPRAHGGVLRHPQLRGDEHGARRDAVRPAARGRGAEPDAQGDGERVPPVDRHGRARARAGRSTRRSAPSTRCRSRPAPIDSPVGVIEAGTVAAQRFTWQGTVDGEPVITVRTNWMMDDGHLSDGWTLGEQRFEVEVDSTDAPPLLVTFHGLHPPVLGEDSWIGLIAAAMHCVNAIPYVVEAEPGIKTYLDLPLIAGRAAHADSATR